MVDDLKPVPQEMADNVLNKDFWEKYAPSFTINDDKNDAAFTIESDALTKHREKLVREGYTHFVQPGLQSPLEDMRQLFGKMVDDGIPPVFSFVFNEMWALSSQLRKAIEPLFDDHAYAMLPDFWGWHVAPGQAGWTPHRDKGAGCLFPDRKPKSLTVWIPLTIAHPLNGCMSLVPAHLDMNYGKRAQDGSIPRAAIKNLAEIRALPGEAGDVFVWTQNVFHWGGHSADEHDLPPRMSVAFEYQRLDVPAWNEPLMPNDVLPTFEQRLALIAKQVKQYTHMYKFGPDLIAVADKIQGAYKLPDHYSGEAAA